MSKPITLSICFVITYNYANRSGGGVVAVCHTEQDAKDLLAIIESNSEGRFFRIEPGVPVVILARGFNLS